jgi:hypothetical protein
MENGEEMGKYFSETIAYDGLGYILATRFAAVDRNQENERIRLI